jgi:hypothetical protein
VSIWCRGPQRTTDPGVWGVYGCIFSWGPVTPSTPCPTLAAGDMAILFEVVLAASAEVGINTDKSVECPTPI